MTHSYMQTLAEFYQSHAKLNFHTFSWKLNLGTTDRRVAAKEDLVGLRARKLSIPPAEAGEAQEQVITLWPECW